MVQAGVASGLSPRVRGNRDVIAATEQGSGPIPACAGEPVGILVDLAELGAYPRVCGGTRHIQADSRRLRGLSPRVRGNLCLTGSPTAYVGPIPACAGEPAAGCPGLHLGRAYPRVCGGTGTAGLPVAAILGLSPRVRGNLNTPGIAATMMRPIPACAGEPTALSSRGRSRRAYPRVCGGTCGREATLVAAEGLSPRVRGNHSIAIVVSGSSGPIPACAGEPPTPSPSSRRPWAYPRVCGGTPNTSNPKPNGRGLSPRVRGNPLELHEYPADFGPIPACAGEPSISSRSSR